MFHSSDYRSPGKQAHLVIRPIAAGEEVTVSYGVGANGKDALWCTPTPERQQWLLQTKGFTCECARCGMPELPRQYYEYVQPKQRALHTGTSQMLGPKKEMALAFEWIHAAECASARCGHAPWAVPIATPLCACDHLALFEMQKPAFHAGEAFVKLWHQMHGSPRSSSGGSSQDDLQQQTLNAFYPAVKKYQPVVAQWLGVDDPDYIKIAKALKGWEVAAASSAVCCHAAGKASPAKPPKKSNGKKKKPP